LSRPVIGIDIGGSKILICVPSQFDGPCLQFGTSTTMDTSREDLADIINSVINRLPQPPSAIGVAVPGLVEDGRVIVSDVLPKISGWRPAASIAVACPVTVLNDVEAALKSNLPKMACVFMRGPLRRFSRYTVFAKNSIQKMMLVAGRSTLPRP
jgi:predicted NBD/HSP70 family sugar kinase